MCYIDNFTAELLRKKSSFHQKIKNDFPINVSYNEMKINNKEK